MLLTIDIGNTRVKGALFEESTLIELFVFSKQEFLKDLEKIIDLNKDISDLVISSVGTTSQMDFSLLEGRVKLHFMTPSDAFPFENLYQTPLTLGIDRLVLASGAVLKYPFQNRLVIDSGTCITYDFINASNQYLGGAISPGIQLRYKSLHDYTAKLPLLKTETPKFWIGNSTEQSIHSGVINGLLGEIDRFIELYKQEYSNFIIILTGGDSEFLAKRLKNTIFANPNFLVESLYHTFQFQNQK